MTVFKVRVTRLIYGKESQSTVRISLNDSYRTLPMNFMENTGKDFWQDVADNLIESGYLPPEIDTRQFQEADEMTIHFMTYTSKKITDIKVHIESSALTRWLPHRTPKLFQMVSEKLKSDIRYMMLAMVNYQAKFGAKAMTNLIETHGDMFIPEDNSKES